MYRAEKIAERLWRVTHPNGIELAVFGRSPCDEGSTDYHIGWRARTFAETRNADAAVSRCELVFGAFR